MPRVLLLTLVLAALGLSAIPASALTNFPAATSELDSACSVPLAIPDDGRDDRIAIQNALTWQGCAHLSPGVYDIESIPFTPPARRQYMMLDASSAQLSGDGPGTVLAFRGSAGGQIWQGILMSGAGSALHDLSITTAALSNTVEQTHAVELAGPATDAEISRVRFNHPIRVTTAGDCVQLVGYNDGREIARVKIRDNDFLHCDRSGVAVHSGTRQLEIVDNRFGDIGNTDLDFEGSGDTSDVLIQHNTFTMSPGPHGVGAIQLQLIDRARITENVLDGRGIDIFQSDDVEIDHNTITFTQATAAPVISVGSDSARTRIDQNSITRDGSAGAGAVIIAGPHGTGTPDHLEIDGNALVQRTSFHVVSSSGVVGLYVRHNAISYDGALSNAMFGVFAIGSAGTTGIRTTDVRVESNLFAGALLAALGTSGSYFGVGTVDTSDNFAAGATFGIVCGNFASQGGVIGPITSTGDSWPAPQCGPAGFVRVFDRAPVETAPPGSEGGPGDGGGAPPGLDTTAPVLSGVSLSPAAFRVAKAAAGVRRGARLRFSSSEAGTLSIRIEHVRPGQPVKRVAQLATLTRAIKVGPGSVTLSGSSGGKPMKPGTYRLTLTAHDPAGNSSTAIRRTFSILAG